MTLAALMGRSGRFLLLSFLLLVGLPLGALAIGWSGESVPPPVVAARVHLVFGLLTLSSVWLLGHRYRTRRVVAGSVGFGLGVAVAIVAGLAWPWEYPRVELKEAKRASGMERVVPTMLGASATTRRGNRAGLTTVKVDLQFKGVPEGLALLDGRAEMVLTWTDGSRVELADGRVSFIGDWETRPAQRALAFEPGAPDAASRHERDTLLQGRREQRLKARGDLTPLAPDGLRAELIIRMRPETFARTVQEPPGCELRLRLTVGRPENLLELPLREAVTVAGRNVRIRVGEITGRTAEAGDASPQLAARWRVQVTGAIAGSVVHPTIFVFNRRHATGWRPVMVPFPRTPRAGRLVNASVEVPVAKVWRDGAGVDALDGWETTMLAVVGFRPDGAFDTAARADRLIFKP